MKKCLITPLVFLLAACPAAAAAGLVLVEDGVARAPIVIAADAPARTRQAAGELAAYLEKITGARPPLLEGRPEPLPARAVWVGFQPVLAELFPGTDFDFRQPEEILVAANENHLVIAGRDRLDPASPTAPAGNFQFGIRDVGDFQFEYGTVNAVYTFLQDYLGVRWLWPGAHGEDVVRRDTVAFEPFEYRYNPQIRMRHAMFFHLAPYRPGGSTGAGSDWARRRRLLLDSLYVPVQGHGFSDWWERFHESHPEYFALQPDGRRHYYPQPHYAKVCEASPAVQDQWLADVADQLEKFPARYAFNAVANDSWTCGHCVCEACRAWEHPENEIRNRFHWAGLFHQEGRALSDRQVNFANALARRLEARFPGRDYYVLVSAYGHSRPAPVAAVPADNVVIGDVANFFLDPDQPDPGSPTGRTARGYFEDWAKVARHHIWRPNTGNRAGFQRGGPVDPAGVIANFRLLAETGCLGINIDTVRHYWATQGPLYYLMAQLAWDPAADGRAALADYYRRAFGPAAPELEAYWDLLAAAFRAQVPGGADWRQAFTPELFARADALFARAREKVAGAPEIYAARLDFFAAGLEFLRLKTENLGLIARLRETGGADADARARALANWERIVELGTRHPGAFDGNDIRWSAPGMLRVIHPDHYAETR